MQSSQQLSIFLWLSVISMCLSAGCNKDEIAAFRGDGTLRYLPSPGMLGTDGYVLQFAPFAVSNAFSAQFTFSDIPVRKDPYWIYLVPDQKAMSLDFEGAAVSFSLSDGDGRLIIGVTNKVADWIESKYRVSLTTITREFQLARAKGDMDFGNFMPKAGNRYFLNISYEPSLPLANSPGTAHFELRGVAGE